MANCKIWLERFLRDNDGERNVSSIRIAAKENGFTRRQVSAAKKELGLITLNDWDAKGESASNWWWRLP